MSQHEQIKEFVRGTLGCGCPEEVFQDIEYRTGAEIPSGSPFTKWVCVGQRLLIYVLEAKAPSALEKLLSDMVLSGKKERDDRGLNRFRAVVATDDVDRLRPVAERIFREAVIPDDPSSRSLAAR